jgi:iron complex transport system substrate-binding protein
MQTQISKLKLRYLTAGWTVLTLLILCLSCGCAKKTVPAAGVNAENTSMRIVSMAPNLTEILFGLGLDADIVGVTKFSTYPAQARDKTCVGTFWQPDMEAVMALRPTLLVHLKIDQQAALGSRLERIGCETLSLQIETVEQLLEAIELIGRTVDKLPEAQAMVQRVQDKQAEIVERYTEREPVKVLWVIQRNPFRVAGQDTFITELIKMAGGVNAIGQTLTQYPPVNIEEVIGAMPDVIIEPVMDPEQLAIQQAGAEEFYRRYAAVPAVRNKRISIIDGDLVSRLGPRLDEAVELVAECLWQE